MSISIKLIDSLQSIETKINSALSTQLNNSLSKNISKLQKDLINQAIPEWLNDQPEIQSLRSGELSGPFGFMTSPTSVADAIIDSVAKSVTLSLSKYNKDLTGGGLEISIQPDNFENLLNLPEGHTIYEDGDLHWLKWMLLKGDEIVVVGYEYNPISGLGRTRLGNMKTGRGFRVPPQYAGTSRNNFITRALTGQKQLDYMTQRIKQVLGA